MSFLFLLRRITSYKRTQGVNGKNLKTDKDTLTAESAENAKGKAKEKNNYMKKIKFRRGIKRIRGSEDHLRHWSSDGKVRE